MKTAPCMTAGHAPAPLAEYCIRMPDERGLIHAINVCADCRNVARKRFPNLQIVPLYTVSRDIPATRGHRL